MSEAVGWYAYGVVPARTELAFDTLAGIDPRFGVGLVAWGDVAALASRVRLDEFGETAVQRNLQDRVWRKRAARAHDAVVTQAMGAGPVVPLRLCTIFPTSDGLLSALRHEETRLRDELRWVQGRAEWGVKILVDRQTDAQAPVDRAVGEAHELLRRHACAAAVLRPQSAELPGRRGRMAHNGAYLVDAGRLHDFAAAAGEIADAQRSRGLHLEVSGPWAPYNFVTTAGATP